MPQKVVLVADPGIDTAFAIAIALHESGTSKYESEKENRRNLAKTARKEAKGQTAQQEREGKAHIGARGKRDNSKTPRQGFDHRKALSANRTGRAQNGKLFHGVVRFPFCRLETL